MLLTSCRGLVAGYETLLQAIEHSANRDYLRYQRVAGFRVDVAEIRGELHVILGLCGGSGRDLQKPNGFLRRIFAAAFRDVRGDGQRGAPKLVREDASIGTRERVREPLDCHIHFARVLPYVQPSKIVHDGKVIPPANGATPVER
ncbi:MAG TPA: hypothetical protein VGP25_00910 [Gemmatimonadaceae bacterium]|nr:hypothetical protein [Gemmatimonadaceae bacterium]